MPSLAIIRDILINLRAMHQKIHCYGPARLWRYDRP